MVEAPPEITPEIADFLQLLNIAWQVSGQPQGLTVTSWWRSRQRNAVVGGMPNSQHLTGLAVDIAANLAGDKFANAARAVGLIPIDEGDHWHVQRFAASEARGLCCGAAVSQVR